MTDEQLRKDVLDEIDWAPEITSTDVNVAADGGVVSLTGFVHSYAERIAAERAAKRVSGVRAVANDVEVRPRTERTDPEIARDVVTIHGAMVGVPSDRLTVTVRGGQVMLEGTVESAYEKEGAECAVSYVAGVKRVFNEIKVRPSVSTVEVKTKIEAALRRLATTDARRIRVEAHDGTIELFGDVNALMEKEEAERAACAAPGVAEVRNHIIIMP